jgi:hypothetical protein
LAARKEVRTVREERERNDNMSHKMSGRLSTFSLSLVFCSFVVLDVRGFEIFVPLQGRRSYSFPVPGQIWSW